MSDLTDQLEKVFCDLMQDEGIPPRQRTRVNCVGWDSLFQLNLILAIEQEFQISLSDEEAIGLNSFESALQILEEKLANKQS